MRKMKSGEFSRVFALMQESFPSSEYRAEDAQRALLADEAYAVWVEEDGTGTVCAFMAVWTLEDVTFLEHFAVSPALRGAGLGGRMLDELSERCGSVCLEAELPQSDIARRRIGFYRRHGFTENPYPYRQPALAPDGEPVPLVLMTLGGGIGGDEFLRIREQLYTRVYRARA